MSPDESASWRAASAPSMAAVIYRQAHLRVDASARGGPIARAGALRPSAPLPGKLPIHELLLHGWIALFGSSLAAMRSLSAALGTLAILLVYGAAREMLAADGGAYSSGEARLAAAMGALIFAVNVVTIKYSRELRMYPLVLAASLAQAALFLRAIRRGGIGNYCGVAILTALAVAANFSAVLLPAAEGLWLLYLVSRARWRPADAGVRRAFAAAVALALPGIVLAPILFASLHASAAMTAGGFIKWIEPPRFYAPIALFNKATGSFAFPVLMALAGWGAIAGWRRGARETIGFALVWMWAPPLAMLAVSYALTPIFVERYALSSFAPFFILTGIGIAALPGVRWRSIALVAAVLFSLGHVHGYDRKPHDAQYREAFAAAQAALRPGDTAVIVPRYAVNVLRYYYPANPLEPVLLSRDASKATLIVLGDQHLSRRAAARYRREFPHAVARLRGVTVLRK
ncbi:MAG: glycosyltransferase family 39 protein [Candidatus Binataceae bacterium]